MKRNYLHSLLSVCSFLLVLQGRAQHPAMYYSDSGVVGKPFAKDPKVVYFKGRYLMYYSVPGLNMQNWYIGIAESNDLTHWKKTGEIKPAATYEKNGLCAPGALVRAGKLNLFYQTYGNGKNDAICHAVSDDGLHFTRNPTNPVFHPAASDWTCGRAIDAEVVQFKDKYLLYFATRDTAYKIQMQGVAAAPLHSSFNRDEWTQLSDSSILKPELPWEKNCVEGASCIRQGNYLYMFYAGAYNNEPQQIGVARSIDGIRWTRLSNEPILKNGKPGTWNESESGHPDIFTDKQGKTYLFFQGNSDKGKSWYLSNVEVSWEKGIPVIKQ